jgi:phosphoglycolate phosphatase
MASLVGRGVEVYLSKVLKLLVFDLDGTLADTRTDLAVSVNHALGKVGRPPLPLESVVAFVGDGARNLLTRSLDAAAAAQAVPVRPGEIDAALEAFLEHYRVHCLGETAAYPGVESSLEKLSGFRKAVLTNKPVAPARTILSGLKLAAHFNQVLGGDNPYGQKPDPAALRHIMQAEGARSEETVLIGDGVQDLRAARAAGTRFLGFLGGMGSPAALRAERPEAVFDDMRRLPEALAALEASAPAALERRV